MSAGDAEYGDLCPEDGDAIAEAEDQMAYMQTVIAVLVRRYGGATSICPEELDAVVGCGIGLTHSDAGLELRIGLPSQQQPVDDNFPLVEERPLFLH